MLKIVLGIALVTSTVVCSATPQRAYSVSPEISSDYRRGTYYFLTKNGDSWKASKTGDLRQDNVERVVVNIKTAEIVLTASPRGAGTYYRNTTKWECRKGLYGTGFRLINDYSVCSSHLTKGVTNPAKAVISGLTLIFGQVVRDVVVDQEAILAIAKSSGLIEMVEEDKQALSDEEIQQEKALALNIYHNAYAAITTPRSINSFIEKYRDNDPEGLITLARSRLPQAELTEYRNAFDAVSKQQSIVSLNNFIAQYSKYDPEQLTLKARELIQGIELKESDRAKALENFRKNLAEGIETSCGLVVEKKGKLAKIQLKSTNSERWVKLDEIYPSGQSCSIAPAVNDNSPSKSTQIGQKICQSLTGTTVSKPTGWEAMGETQYQKYNGHTNLVGFVEGSSSNKIQIRISGISFSGEIDQRNRKASRLPENINESLGSMDGYKGSRVQTGSVIWDDYSAWLPCD